MGNACSCHQGKEEEEVDAPGLPKDHLEEKDPEKKSFADRLPRGSLSPRSKQLKSPGTESKLPSEKKSWSPRRARANKVDMSDKEVVQVEMDRHARTPSACTATRGDGG
tara:strand:+ start:48 stop:374 length:327 start_codon:yes stop_codon:yes gene_type:complete